MKLNMQKIFVATFLIVVAIALAGCQRTTTHRVTFDQNYDNAPNAIVVEVESGQTVTAPTVNREGYLLTGWAVSPTSTTTWDFSTGIEEDMTLYARWEIAEDMVEVTYVYNYQGAPASIVEHIEEGTIPPVVDVNREGYTFFGWFTDDAGQHHFDFTQTVDEDLTLYAYWVEAQRYYLGTSANGYQTPRDGGYAFEPVLGRPGFYTLTIEFTEDNRDPMYDGHYYKVSRGGWGQNEVWGADHYAFQPAPEKVLPDGQVAGLGSIYIKEDTTLTILFDANTKTIYDDYVQALPAPRIYGDFNEAMDRGSNWSTALDEALVLSEELEEGVFTGLFKLPAYTGDGDGYSMAVALSVQFNFEWNMFVVVDQYRFDGSAAGMGSVSYLEPNEETIYEFIFDYETKVTTIETAYAGEIRVFENPLIYGCFNNWSIRGENVFVLVDYYGAGVYEGSLVLPGYDGDDDGHMLVVVLSKILYDDAWGIRWGAHEQYLFDGTAGGMGSVSYLAPEAETFYTFLFDEKDKTTTVIAPEHGDERLIQGPSVYGDFNMWDYFGPNSVFLYDEEGDGIYRGTLALPAYTGDGDGYSIIVAITHQFYDDEWGQRWAVGTQYKLDGEAAGMGQVSYLAPDEDTMYLLTYDSVTNITEVTVLEGGDVIAFDTPRIYGDFNGWAINGPQAMAFQATEDEGIYEGEFYFEAYDGDDDGYMIAVVLSQRFYDDEWGQRFGAEEQYLLDGTPGGMGVIDTFAPEVSGVYRFIYDATTKETTIERQD